MSEQLVIHFRPYLFLGTFVNKLFLTLFHSLAVESFMLLIFTRGAISEPERQTPQASNPRCNFGAAINSQLSHHLLSMNESTQSKEKRKRL